MERDSSGVWHEARSFNSRSVEVMAKEATRKRWKGVDSRSSPVAVR